MFDKFEKNVLVSDKRIAKMDRVSKQLPNPNDGIQNNKDSDVSKKLISIEDDYPEMSVIEIDDFVAMRACEMHDYMYNIIRPDDIVVPPKNDLFQKDKMA